MAPLPDKPAVARQVLRAKITIGDTDYDVTSFDRAVTASVDTVEVRTVGAGKTVYLPGAVANAATLEVKVLQNATGATAPKVGDMVDLKIAVDYSENGAVAVSEPAAEAPLVVPCFVQQVAADKIEGAGGSRLMTWTITLQPTQIPPAIV